MMRLLILDSDEDTLRRMVRRINELGHRADGTLYVEDAKRYFRKRKYDGLICDLQAKEKHGKISSGLRFVEYVRNYKKADVPIVLTSGIDLIYFENLVHFRIDMYRMKPFLKGLDFFIQEVEGLLFRKLKDDNADDDDCKVSRFMTGT